MPRKTEKRKQSPQSQGEDDGDNDRSDSGHKMERRKKVRWEHASNTLDEEGDFGDSDEDSKGLEKAISLHASW